MTDFKNTPLEKIIEQDLQDTMFLNQHNQGFGLDDIVFMRMPDYSTKKHAIKKFSSKKEEGIPYGMAKGIAIIYDTVSGIPNDHKKGEFSPEGYISLNVLILKRCQMMDMINISYPERSFDPITPYKAKNLIKELKTQMKDTLIEIVGEKEYGIIINRWERLYSKEEKPSFDYFIQDPVRDGLSNRKVLSFFAFNNLSFYDDDILFCTQRNAFSYPLDGLHEAFDDKSIKEFTQGDNVKVLRVFSEIYGKTVNVMRPEISAVRITLSIIQIVLSVLKDENRMEDFRKKVGDEKTEKCIKKWEDMERQFSRKKH